MTTEINFLSKMSSMTKFIFVEIKKKTIKLKYLDRENILIIYPLKKVKKLAIYWTGLIGVNLENNLNVS